MLSPGVEIWRFYHSALIPFSVSLFLTCKMWQMAGSFALLHVEIPCHNPFPAGTEYILSNHQPSRMPPPLELLLPHICHIFYHGDEKNNTHTWALTWYIDTIRILSLQWPHCLCIKRNWGSRKITCLGKPWNSFSAADLEQITV